MKKCISMFTALAMTMGCLAGPSFVSAEEKPAIVTTIFPIYDWVREIAGDNIDDFDLTMLLDSGVDLHSYQPTPEDILKVSNADLFIYVGGESDEWVEDILNTSENPDLKAINLVEAMGEDIKAEETVEGMEHEHHEEESEAHEKEVSTFEDDEVQDRPLSDWAGEWQSGYPYVLDGSLDEGFEHKAESGSMTAEEYKEYYATGYETDLQYMTIDGENNTIEYTDVNNNTCKSEYKYVGYYIQNWSTGTKAAMYRFEALDKESGVPVYIEFNDHIIEPCKAEHFHFRTSDTSFDDIVDPENRWPTFWPASMDGEEILEAFIGHDHEEEAEDEALTTENIEDRSLEDFAGEWKSLAPMLAAGELDAFCTYKADSDEDPDTTKETVFEKYTGNWACDAVNVQIDGDTMTFTSEDGSASSADYTYAGYTPVMNEDGTVKSVRYQFTTESADAPKYVQFNDHGHEPGAAEHFHIYFGNESFEALLNASSNPFFVPAEASVSEIISELIGHDEHDHEHEHEHEEEEELDEHVWLSLRNAEKLVTVIAEAMGEIDPDGAQTLSANANAYIAELEALDAQYQTAVDGAARDTLLFADRFPFRYLVDDYGLDYYAAFSGCSAETEASFATVVFLAQMVNELELSSVMTIEGSDHKIAETVVSTSDHKDAQILTMDSLQSVTAQQVEAGTTYLDVMKSNLEVLQAALK